MEDIAEHSGPNPRQETVLRQNWRFCKADIDGAAASECDDAEWEQITIPHTWNTDLIKNQKSHDYYLGVGWYRSEIDVTDDMKDKRLFLRFEGALMTADVFVNGKEAGRHEGGYTAFCFEITSLVKPGRNALAVKVDNAFNDDVIPAGHHLFTRFGGIYRPVTLIVTDQVCITPLDYASAGVYIRQRNVSEKEATVDVLSKLLNAGQKDASVTVTSTILDAEGKMVAEDRIELIARASEETASTQSIKVADPHLWDARRDPYLYSVDVCVRSGETIVDRVLQPLGLRYYTVDKEKGFILNGRRYPLYGTCRHQEWEHEGSALSDEHHIHDVACMAEMGANALRLAHYPQATTMYDQCDLRGLVCWAEIPLVKPYPIDNPRLLANAKLQLVELIRQTYNHPSIILWGLYNEVLIPGPHVQALHNLAKQEDPDRLTAAASNQMGEEWSLLDRQTVTDIMCWNRYPLWYSEGGRMDDWADSMAREHGIVFGISEYGAGGCVNQHQQNPTRPDPDGGRFYPEEYESIVHETVWPQIHSRQNIFCSFIWNTFDFSWSSVSRGERINVNNKGLVTYDRQIKKDAFFYYKANWSDEPVLHITSRRHVERDEATTDVKVYSNCQDLRLTLNGTDYAPPQGAYGVFVWQALTLQEGENEVSVGGTRDGEVFSDTCKWIYHPETTGKTEQATKVMEE